MNDSYYLTNAKIIYNAKQYIDSIRYWDIYIYKLEKTKKYFEQYINY